MARQGVGAALLIVLLTAVLFGASAVIAAQPVMAFGGMGFYPWAYPAYAPYAYPYPYYSSCGYYDPWGRWVSTPPAYPGSC